MSFFRKFLFLLLVFGSYVLSANTCDYYIERVKLFVPFQMRYFTLSPKSEDLTKLEDFSNRKLKELSKISDDNKFYKTVHNVIDKDNIQRYIVSGVNRRQLDNYIESYDLSQQSPLDIFEFSAICRYNQLFGTDYKEYSELPSPDFQGGEAHLYKLKKHAYPKSENKDLVLKIWLNNPKQFDNSSIGLEILYNMVEQSSTGLNKTIYVVKTFETGDKYIIREFYNGKTIELSKAIKENKNDYDSYTKLIATNQELKEEDYTNKALVTMIKTINLLTKTISNKNSKNFNNPLLRNLKFFMRSSHPSDNLLWDPVAEKIIVIDTPGY